MTASRENIKKIKRQLEQYKIPDECDDAKELTIKILKAHGYGPMDLYTVNEIIADIKKYCGQDGINQICKALVPD